MIRVLKILSVLAVVGAGFSFTPAFAQSADGLPDMPKPLQNLINDGAQYRYLGKDNGMDAWLTVKNGVEQYFYVMPDGKAFVMGIMFDAEGKAVTFQQVKRLQDKGDDLLDNLAELPEPNPASAEQNLELQSPAEKMFSDVQSSNWVPMGKPDAPVIYSFIDPQCPHCHAFIDEVLAGKYLDDGKVQIRLIPVGFKDETRAQAAFLIASPNPQERFIKYLEGDKAALPAKAEINQQGVQRNMAVMQSWNFDATPMGVYRAKDGSVKLIRGKPENLKSVIADLGVAG